MLKSNTLIAGVTALVIGGLGVSVATGVMADRGGKHGKGMIMRICGPDAAEKHAERSAKIQGVLNLTAEQQVLFNVLEAQQAATATKLSPLCDKIVEGERPSKEVRKEFKSAMKEAKEGGEDAREAFRDSLSDEQRKAMRKLRKEMRKEKRKQWRNSQ